MRRPKKNRRNPWSLLIGVVMMVVLLISCGWDDQLQRTRQIRTSTDMQQVVAEIEKARDKSDTSPADLERILAGHASIEDAWGEPLLWAVEATDTRAGYVLVSKGRDGKLDVGSIDAYFSAPGELISGEFDRDFVFRNGVAIQNAGK